MKRILPIVIAVCLAVLFGCQADNTAEVVGGGENSLTISLEDTRVVFGEKSNGVYPLYWSEGDCIVVNGVKSNEAQIDAQNKCRATFEFGTTIEYPFNVTYPYCSTATASQPVVEFKSEQSYTEGTFDRESLPICGYQASKSEKLTISHIAGVVRFPVVSTFEGAVLKKIVITSTSNQKLAGHFSVTCSTAKITPLQDATNSVTYYLPDNFTLSKSEESVFYISLPAVNIGTCTVEFIESNGEKMTATWAPKSITAGKVREFSTIKYKRGVAGSLDGFVIEEDEIFVDSACGYVRDESGNPIKGVAVSDGFTVVTTNERGYYAFDASRDAWYIYVTVPSEYEIPLKNGVPNFYQRYDKSQKRYDFTLKPLAGGKEEKFALFVIGDPQVGTQAGLDRLNAEAVPAIKKHATTLQAEGVPCYGVTLGDLISNNNTSDRSQYREPVFDAFAVSKSGMPIFHVMGNHDNTFFNSSKPLYPDERSSTFELKAQRAHEEVCGPVNFSFDRGDMHIVCMRNLLYNRNDDCGAELRRGFIKEHYYWLKADLALVPKDKTVILCVHLPMLDGGGSYVDYTRNLINEYREAHIMSGHSHLIHSVEAAKQENIYEHNMGALCGAWWTSYMCGDGSPAGYGVFTCEGATFTDWYHVGYDETSKNRSHQMRLYRGDAITGAEISGSNTSKTKGYYAFNFDDDILLANVYMADSQWTISVYEDGEYSGEMELISTENILSDAKYYARPKIYKPNDGYTDALMEGNGSYSSPFCSPVPTAGDIYASGYIGGVRGHADHTVGSNAQCYHMYMYRLKKKNFDKIKVVAEDKRFNRTYTETKVTTGTDYSLIQY